MHCCMWKKKKKNQSCVSYNIPDSVVNFFRSQINSTALCNLLLCSLPFVLQKIVYVMWTVFYENSI